MTRFILQFAYTLFCCPLICAGQFYQSVIITEIMADPTPAVGLAEVEYIEIYNLSNQPVSLKNWKLTMGSRSVALPDSTLSPDSYTILCHGNHAVPMSKYGSVIGLNTFSLTNDGMLLALFDADNKLVYSTTYQNKQWESGKKNGGYALEMVDVSYPCGERENWRTTVSKAGGTPGGRNSIKENLINTFPPKLDRVDVIGTKELSLIFDKKLDSMQAVTAAVIELPGRQIIRKELKLPDFKILTLMLNEPLLQGQEYTLLVRNLADCSGNILRDSEKKVVLPVDADSGDVVINEILFNPLEGGVDFVEIYNMSSKHISLKNWSLGTGRPNNVPAFIPITDQHVILPAHGYLVLTSDASTIEFQYPYEKSRHFLEMPVFPAYTNVAGEVFLRGGHQQSFDRFVYSEDMHHILLADYKGISIEKIDFRKPSTDWSNWHSAASTSGYATPGYANSQFRSEATENLFSVEPEIFTPNADGLDDFTRVHYQQNVIGQLATVCIYNSSGRMVRVLANNQLLGTQGYFLWDGTDERGAILDTGYYFIMAETFNTNGSTMQFRCKVVVATREH
jgi:hypothetical protein